ncbi:MAG: hypothetical protein OXQ89_12015 [Rhodospirillaceae bacterium]|nr:hypothetical protein [Rhodospirillaceae bacterium]
MRIPSETALSIHDLPDRHAAVYVHARGRLQHLILGRRRQRIVARRCVRAIRAISSTPGGDADNEHDRNEMEIVCSNHSDLRYRASLLDVRVDLLRQRMYAVAEHILVVFFGGQDHIRHMLSRLIEDLI